MPDSRFEAFKLSMGSSSSSTKLTGLDKLPLSYASVSIGCRDSHTLPKKLEAIAKAGFQAIELGFPDLVTFASQHLSKKVSEYDFDDLCEAGKEVKRLCQSHNLSILILQPFANFEGWAKGSEERKNAWTRIEGYTRIMEAVGTDLLQVGSTDTPEDKIGLDRNRFVKDLTELADYMAKRNFRVAYENWCWSTHAPLWEDVWDICKQVDRANFGLCLDTFQSAGREWADPTTASGLLEDGRSRDEVEKAWKASCEKLGRTVPKDKIFVLQISDVYKLKQPFEDKVVDGQRPRARWSHDYRPLPGEGYLPVADFAVAVLKTGFRGWFSYEVFDSGPDGKGKEYELDDYLRNAMESQKKLAAECEKAE